METKCLVNANKLSVDDAVDFICEILRTPDKETYIVTLDKNDGYKMLDLIEKCVDFKVERSMHRIENQNFDTRISRVRVKGGKNPERLVGFNANFIFESTDIEMEMVNRYLVPRLYARLGNLCFIDPKEIRERYKSYEF